MFLFRPEPGWQVTAETARGLGLTVHGQPLFTVKPERWKLPDASAYDGLLVGSSNVFRHGGDDLSALRKLPVYAVGSRTAEAAQGAGFRVAKTGRGGLQTVIDALEGRELHLLRLAGKVHVPLITPPGITFDTRVVYRAVAQELDPTCAQALRKGGVVALHSGEAARCFAAEADRLKLDRKRLAIAALGPRIVELAGEGWEAVHIAKSADDSSLLALIKALCQKPG